jgi:hypothetical protein
MREYSLDELRECIKESRGYINAVYLHWTAGRYGQYFDDYHINIDYDGKIYMPDEDLTIKRAHTWKRNSNAVGIAVCGMYGAKINNGWNIEPGDYDVTDKQIEVMSIIVAMFIKYGGVDISDVLTHCEAAYFDGYGPYSGDEDTRVDLWFLRDSAFNNQPRHGGEVLRGKANWYLQNANI